VFLLLQKRKIKLLTLIISTSLILLFSIGINAKTSSWVHLVDIANPMPLEQIKQRYTAHDIIDGDLTNKITFSTSYNHLSCTVGEYDLIVSVTNKRNITKEQIDKILVRDFINPTILIKEPSITISLGNQTPLEIIKNNIIFSDNLDTNLLEENIIIKNQPTFLEEGIFQLEIYCLDTSLNPSNTVSFEVEIIDNTISTILSTVLNVTKKHTKNEIIELLKKEHNIANEYKNISIESSYFDKETKEGTYYAKIIITHNDDQIETITFKINYNQNNLFDIPMWIFYTLFGIIILIITLFIIYKKRN